MRTQALCSSDVGTLSQCSHYYMQWRTEGRDLGFSTHPPTPEIPKALQNHAKLNLIVKAVKNC